MLSTAIETAQKMWATWNIRAFVIVSLSVQVFLILFAPFRKTRGKKTGKCIYFLIWSIYLFADWVAGFAIGLIVSKQAKSSAESCDILQVLCKQIKCPGDIQASCKQIKSPAASSDIQVLWAPFLLLHLGGPDTITSFALEDNEFWLRHLLGLLLQVGSTAYVFIKSLPENKLWLPTILVAVAGIIKYAERNRAFYLASFDQLGDGWVPSEWGDELPIPVVFRTVDKPIKHFEKSLNSILWTAVHHFGTIKMTLVGPFLSQDQSSDIRETFLNVGNHSNVLQVMEIELSLLYEVLHTKLPVVGCPTGYVFRFITMSCILGALLSFSLFKKHQKLELFDIWLTYGLLIGALLLDFISIILLSLSDWVLGAYFQSMESRCLGDHLQSMESGFFNKFKFRFFIQFKFKFFTKSRNKPRWSRAVSQMNFITYHVKYSPVWLRDIADLLGVGVLFEAIKGIRCLSFRDFEERQWQFIYEEVKDLCESLIKEVSRPTGVEASQAWRSNSKQTLGSFSNSTDVANILEELDYTKSVLTWHIATEICLHEEGQTSGSGTGEDSGTEENQITKEICKLLSDYMFYLLIMQPAMMAAVSVSWKTVFEDTLAEAESLASRTSVSEASTDILGLKGNPKREIDGSVLFAASALAKLPKKSSDWKSMSKVWVHLMCFAAINCRPQVHAQQPSKGGELLTFVWLLMNHMGVGTQFSSRY
ncbi:hypothetical protein SLE2022_058020 [Rubroshorea leprosula]